jgi:hypothetical protein
MCSQLRAKTQTRLLLSSQTGRLSLRIDKPSIELRSVTPAVLRRARLERSRSGPPKQGRRTGNRGSIRLATASKVDWHLPSAVCVGWALGQDQIAGDDGCGASRRFRGQHQVVGQPGERLEFFKLVDPD